MATETASRISIVRMIVIPSLITLGVTLLRLFGELQHWSRVLFNPDAGGPGSIIGIAWLAPIFGIYFALKLSKRGLVPDRLNRAMLSGLIGIGIVVVGFIVSLQFVTGFRSQLAVFCLIFALAAVIQYPAWPELFKVLLAYAYAARIPVAIVMFFAMRGDWQTHYDVLPPDSPPVMNLFWPKYIWLGFLPQLIAWVGYTVLMGSLFGSVAAAIFRRRKPATEPSPA